jgi:putative SOS response-associated peptidase YedK
MCGRFSLDSRANKIVSNLFNMRFEAETNSDLPPTQNVSTIIKLNTYQQMDAQWGIKPNWSKKLIINA